MTMTTTTAATDWVLRGRGLTLGYGGHALFRDLTVEVGRGEMLGIVGPNGSGKTTLLRTLLGLMQPLAGRVERRPGTSIGYVPQRERVDVILPVTTLEVVLMGPAARAGALHRIGAPEREAGREALALLGIEPLGDRLFRSLSTGQQRRVLLARALAGRPDLLVLDEPTAGMDIASEAAMLEFLRGVNRTSGVTILIVTHLLPIVLNLATSILLMADGTVLQGRVDEVLREDRLAALYGVPVHLGVVAGQRTLVVARGGPDHV
jgi:ABC-type Mn2+/Zn2+ transport system ATPase subunit